VCEHGLARGRREKLFPRPSNSAPLRSRPGGAPIIAASPLEPNAALWYLGWRWDRSLQVSHSVNLKPRPDAGPFFVATPPTEAAYGRSWLRIRRRWLSKALNTPVRADRKPSASLTLWLPAARRSMSCCCLTIRSFAPAMCWSAWVRWANSLAMMALPFSGGSATGLSATDA